MVKIVLFLTSCRCCSRHDFRSDRPCLARSWYNCHVANWTSSCHINLIQKEADILQRHLDRENNTCLCCMLNDHFQIFIFCKRILFSNVSPSSHTLPCPMQLEDSWTLSKCNYSRSVCFSFPLQHRFCIFCLHFWPTVIRAQQPTATSGIQVTKALSEIFTKFSTFSLYEQLMPQSNTSSPARTKFKMAIHSVARYDRVAVLLALLSL